MDVSNFPIAKTIDKALEKPATTSGKVINALLLAVFSPLLKYEVKKEAEIESYKQSILNEISKIPKEKQIEPSLNIVGPAIEASKFYIENDDLKLMFAKLIASSMSIDTKDHAHPSFVEVIKQLSPLDAQNLKLFSTQVSIPIAKFRFENDIGNGIDYKTNVFLSNPNCTNIDLLATSISNINRLGLIDIDYSSHLVDDSLYTVFENNSEYLKYKDFLNIAEYKEGIYFLQDERIGIDFSTYNKIVVKKGIVSITPLGKAFIKTCI